MLLRPTMPFVAAGAVFAGALLAPLRVGAASELVLVVGDAGDPVVQRVRNELELMGYASEVVAGSRRAWAREARQRDAAAVVEVDGDRGEVVLWPAPIAKRERARDGYRVEGEDQRVLALRAAELLSGSLASVAEPVPADTGERTSDRGPAADGDGPASEPAASDRASPAWSDGARGGVLLGPALTVTAGGVPPTVGMRVHGVWRPRPWLEAGGLVLVPVSGATLAVPGGESEARLAAFGGSVQLRGSTPTVAVGAGPHVLAQRSWHDVTLESSNFDDTSASRWAPRIGVGLSVAWRLHSLLALRGDAMLDAVLPPLEVMEPANPSAVQQARREVVARIGNPIATFSIGIEVQFGAP